MIAGGLHMDFAHLYRAPHGQLAGLNDQSAGPQGQPPAVDRAGRLVVAVRDRASSTRQPLVTEASTLEGLFQARAQGDIGHGVPQSHIKNSSIAV